MKKKLFMLSMFATAIFLFGNKTNAQNNASTLLRHIVIITFKQDASADGINVSTRDSGVVKHVYVTSFASKDDMKLYAKIPEYARLFKISLPISEDVTVADYWVNK